MKVVHLVSSGSGGGASIACKRINNALRSIDVDSEILVQAKQSNDRNVNSIVNGPLSKLAYYFRFAFDESFIRLLTVQNRGRFSNPTFGSEVSKHPLVPQADIINLHWINGGFLSLNSLIELGKLNKPIVWTLHDMWAFTGGCHYNLGCDKFIEGCNNCPSLKLRGDNDLSSKIFSEKKKVYKNLKLTIVTCSRWLADEAKKSQLLKDLIVENIPNPIDPEIFKPMDKNKARQKLKLPLNKFLILFGSMNVKDVRKGFKYFVQSLEKIFSSDSKFVNKIELIIFGTADEDLLIEIPFKVHSFGKSKNESEIVSCYNAADIFIAASLQDNLPNTVLESIACGTPVVAFNIGGIPDMVVHQKNGYLAEFKSVGDLSNGILWFYNNNDIAGQFSEYARENAIKKFTPQLIGEKYLDLYKSLL